MFFILLPIAASVIALIFFLTQKRQSNAAWQRFRDRFERRQQRAVRDEPPDPNVQFDKPE
jgi:hypothetical protein